MQAWVDTKELFQSLEGLQDGGTQEATLECIGNCLDITSIHKTWGCLSVLATSDQSTGRLSKRNVAQGYAESPSEA
jgi:hypothetical protein